jgi:hypothetical protein
MNDTCLVFFVFPSFVGEIYFSHKYRLGQKFDSAISVFFKRRGGLMNQNDGIESKKNDVIL